MSGTTTLPPLHPDHLADLRRSGLADETIVAVGDTSDGGQIRS